MSTSNRSGETRTRWPEFSNLEKVRRYRPRGSLWAYKNATAVPTTAEKRGKYVSRFATRDQVD